MKSLAERVDALVKSLGPMQKNFLPADLIPLLRDLCAKVDQLEKEHQK